MLVKDPQLVNEYKHILNIMHHHLAKTETEIAGERLEWAYSDNSKFRIKRLNKYEYFILLLKPKYLLVHIDGIQEERDGVPLNHPVHQIRNVTDIYLDNIELIKNKYRRKIKNLQFIDIT